jgi:hypothetical protein
MGGMRGRTRAFRSLVAVSVLTAMVVSPIALRTAMAAKNTSGALYTTDSPVCAATNKNIYANRGVVRLRSQGLPDGSYYVKVTSPSGTLLGSSDGAVLTVSGGTGDFDGCPSLWFSVRKASDGTVGYDPTPSSGGEYKVWVSQSANFAGAKTDNFKVADNECDPNGGANGCEGPPGDETCSDGVDNDGDDLIDGNDPDCQQPPPTTQCNDGVDNADPEDELVDAADPGCHTDGDASNPDSYDPTDNDETDEPAATQCNDGVDNADPEDELVDAADPGCHTDGDASNPDSYDPTDNDETDEGGGAAKFSCRASVLRIEDNPIVAALTGTSDPFEPWVANSDQNPCATGNAGLLQDLGLTGGDEPVLPGSDGEIVLGGGPNDPGKITIGAANSKTSEADNSAESYVVKVALEGGGNSLEVDVARSVVSARCDGIPLFTSKSSIVRIAGNGMESPSDPQVIPLGPLGTLYLNYSEDTGTGTDPEHTARAVWLDGSAAGTGGDPSPLGSVIVAEAIADAHGNPCAA